MRRVSIRTLMAFIVVTAVGLAALRGASEQWAQAMLMTALCAVGVAVIGAILMAGRERAWWIGFAVFAGGYLYLSAGPWAGDSFRHELITTHWIGQLRNRMFPTNVEYLLGEKQELEAELAKLRPSTPNIKYDPVVATLTHNLRSIEAQLTASRNRGLRYDHFQRVGHSLCALLAGLVGGTIAVGFWGRRERGQERLTVG